jgi:hypothetical protein
MPLLHDPDFQPDYRHTTYVRFRMIDGPFWVFVRVSYRTIAVLGHRDRVDLGTVPALFGRYRAKIEQAASIRYDKVSEKGGDLVVLAYDL